MSHVSLRAGAAGYEFGLETATADSGESGIKLKLRIVSP